MKLVETCEDMCMRCGCTCGRRRWRPRCSTGGGGDKVVARRRHLATNAALASHCFLGSRFTASPAPTPRRLPREHNHKFSSASARRQPSPSPHLDFEVRARFIGTDIAVRYRSEFSITEQLSSFEISKSQSQLPRHQARTQPVEALRARAALALCGHAYGHSVAS